MRRELSRPNIRLRIEYGPEGGGDPKAIEVYSAGEVRELTYEAMDEVLTQRYISCYGFATDSGVRESTRLCSICLGESHLHR